MCVCRLKLYFAVSKKDQNTAGVVRSHRMVTATSTSDKDNSKHLKQGTICTCKASTQNFGYTYFILLPQRGYSQQMYVALEESKSRGQKSAKKILKLQHGNLSFLNCVGQTADHSKMYGKETK